jgi:hypothetical protein
MLQHAAVLRILTFCSKSCCFVKLPITIHCLFIMRNPTKCKPRTCIATSWQPYAYNLEHSVAFSCMKSRPPLWSSCQSSWLQIQRSGFDSRRYQIYWEVVGLERGPLSLVSTTEELLGRKCSSSGLENLDYDRGILHADHVASSIRKRLALTSPTKTTEFLVRSPRKACISTSQGLSSHRLLGRAMFLPKFCCHSWWVCPQNMIMSFVFVDSECLMSSVHL